MIKPRKKSSNKKQDLPLDYTKMIREVIEAQFKAQTKGKKVVIEGFIYLEEVCLRIGFQSDTGIHQVNFEASVDYSMKQKNVLGQLNKALDGLGSLMSQYFEADGDIEVPKEWHPFELDGTPVFMKVSTDNTDLEDAAEEFLSKVGSTKTAHDSGNQEKKSGIKKPSQKKK
jgi:hypothetical protein